MHGHIWGDKMYDRQLIRDRINAQYSLEHPPANPIVKFVKSLSSTRCILLAFADEEKRISTLDALKNDCIVMPFWHPLHLNNPRNVPVILDADLKIHDNPHIPRREVVRDHGRKLASALSAWWMIKGNLFPIVIVSGTYRDHQNHPVPYGGNALKINVHRTFVIDGDKVFDTEGLDRYTTWDRLTMDEEDINEASKRWELDLHKFYFDINIRVMLDEDREI